MVLNITISIFMYHNKITLNICALWNITYVQDIIDPQNIQNILTIYIVVPHCCDKPQSIYNVDEVTSCIFLKAI